MDGEREKRIKFFMLSIVVSTVFAMIGLVDQDTAIICIMASVIMIELNSRRRL